MTPEAIEAQLRLQEELARELRLLDDEIKQIDEKILALESRSKGDLFE